MSIALSLLFLVAAPAAPSPAPPPVAAERAGLLQEDTVPEGTVPEGTVPEGTVPEGTVPEDPVPEDPVPEDPVPEDPSGELAELVERYEQALAEHAAERAEGERPPHPAVRFLPLFEELGATEPRAYLWVLDHLREARLSLTARRARADELYARLLAPGVPDVVVVDACLVLEEHARNLGEEAARELLAAVLEAREGEEVRAAALLGLALVVSDGGRTRDAAELEEATALLERALTEFPGTRPARAAAEQAFRLLDAEYWRAAREHFDALETGEATPEDHPARAMYPRYERLAAAGSGRALVWTLEHVDASGLPLDERAARAASLRQRLLAEYADHDLMVDFARSLPDRALAGEAKAEIATARALLERSANPDVRAETLFALAAALTDAAETDEDHAEVEALLARLAEEFPGHRLVEEGASLLARRNLRVGRPAPDFEAEDVEGVAFRLSDYRGKVVLLDFWGFW